jgi:hypothetical protein
MNLRDLVGHALVGVALVVCGSMPARAQLAVGQQATVIQTVTRSAYVNGGVGADEQATMRSVAKEFPLRIVFSAGRDNEFLADIPMVISNADGNSIFALRRAGPMLYVMLPQGRYKVSAQFNGAIQTRQVDVTARNGKDLSFHWQASPNESAPESHEGLIESSLDRTIQ